MFFPCRRRKNRRPCRGRDFTPAFPPPTHVSLTPPRTPRLSASAVVGRIAVVALHPRIAAASPPCAGSPPTGRAARWPRPCAAAPPPPDQSRRRCPSLRRSAIQRPPWGQRRWRRPWRDSCPRRPRVRPQCRWTPSTPRCRLVTPLLRFVRLAWLGNSHHAID
jgi:hypothetical protein